MWMQNELYSRLNLVPEFTLQAKEFFNSLPTEESKIPLHESCRIPFEHAPVIAKKQMLECFVTSDNWITQHLNGESDLSTQLKIIIKNSSELLRSSTVCFLVKKKKKTKIKNVNKNHKQSYQNRTGPAGTQNWFSVD